MKFPGKLLLAAILVLFCAPSCRQDGTAAGIDAQFADPPMEVRPFVRWWWNGDRIEAEELVRELHLLKEAGIGGVEINPIETPYGADTTETRALRLLSDEWIDLLKVTFDEASRLGMRCDLLMGSGWPFGAETLPMDERASVLLLNAVPLPEGRFETNVDALCKAVDPGVTIPNPERKYELTGLWLVPDPVGDLSEAVDVLDRVRNDSVRLEVPDGKHYLYALVRYDSFACVINGAPGASGSILNHFDARAVRKYLDTQADAIEGRIGPLSQYLRSFFVDSMELEGSNWCSDLPEEFLRRRGYDLMPWLPFILFKVGRLGETMDYHYGAAKSPEFQEKVNRVRFDFELTKAELLHERYTETFLAWCREKGVQSRAQAYGRGFFPLESSLGYDIPEGESWTTNWLKHRLGEEMGDADYRRGRGYTMINKYVSSASNLTGKRIVSSEEMTNTYRVFNTSLELLKIGSDMGAFSGTTLPVWSGYNYSPPSAAFPGWVQYGSYSLEGNPFWPYFRLLNDYRARVSAILTNVDMVTDVAILPANSDLWTELGVQTDPFPWYLNVPYTSLIWEAVHKNGGGADYLSDRLLAEATVRRGELCYGKKAYGTLILPEVKTISPEAMKTLERFVQRGGRVFCIGCRPSLSPGLKDCGERDAEIQKRVSRLLKHYPERFVLLDKAPSDAYLEAYAEWQRDFELPHAVEIGSPDRFLLQNHYCSDDGTDYFLFSNVSLTETLGTSLLFPDVVARHRQAVVYDPADGRRYRLDGQWRPDRSFATSLTLGPARTVLIGFCRGREDLPLWAPLPTSGARTQELDRWSLELRHSRRPEPVQAELDSLFDLRERWPDFMGTACYKTTLTLLEKPSEPCYINLGKVCEIASLRVNGETAGVRWWGESVFDLSGLLKEGDNVIEVEVRTLMGNYMQTLTDNPVVQRFLLGRKRQESPAMGLIGPVTVYSTAADPLYEGFLQPERSFCPRVWWHWMNGNISTEGIRKDLEWMDRAGVVGFHNFDANMATPQVVDSRLVYMTPEWKEAFRYALDLADSLQMEVSIASSPGWSITGGPWVSEDDAQKKVVWRDTTVRGGCRIQGTLPDPIRCCGPYQDIPLYPNDPGRYAYYQDLFVLAVRLPDDRDDIPAPELAVSDPAFDLDLLQDGRLGTDAPLTPDASGYAWIEFRYPSPVSLQSLYLADFTGVPVKLEVDRNGDGTFETLVEDVPMSRIKTTTVRSFDFPKTEGRVFRIRARIPDRSLKPSEARFDPFPRVNLVEDKAGYLPHFLVYDRYPTPSVSEAPSLRDVLDISRFVQDGVMDWKAPEGTWKIFRFGYNLEGRRNGPASPEATGLEVDKLNAAAVRRYYDSYLALYQDASEGGLGKTIHCLMIDSYESGKGNWTPDLEQEFRRRRGYDLRPWMPVLTGEIIGSAEESEQFLFDWRITLGELMAENHYDIVSDILAPYGMTRYTESHEWRKAFVGDGMMPKRKAGVPMAAMWIHQTDEGRHSSYPSGDADIRESSSIAHIYGQNICAAESFTVDGRLGERNGQGAYQSHPGSLKPLADAMLAEGLNRFVVHCSVHQPVDSLVPGLSLGPFGQWFNRHDTWAEEARTWTDYLSRNCYMMQQGRWVADIAWFYGEDKNVTGMYIEEWIPVPEGYNFDLVNADILQHELTAERGCLVTKTGMRYRALVLDPDLKYISLPVLRRIRNIQKAGIPVFGPRPLAKANLKGSERRWQRLVGQIWDETNPPVTDKEGLRAALQAARIEPDADLGAIGEADIRFVHRHLDDGELYWVANITPEYRDLTVSFRTDGCKPEIWHADSGLREAASYRIRDGRTWVDLHFTPDDAQYILFREPADLQEAVVPMPEMTVVKVLDGPWQLRFEAKYDPVPGPVTLPVLRDLSSSPVEGIRFFSGTAVYSCRFEGDETLSGQAGKLLLDLGAVHHTARVFLNGKDLGLAWKVPYQIDVSGKILPGGNRLEIRVTNSWANRLMGDERKPADARVTFTPEQFYTADDQPIPSGLVGPVRILCIDNQ